MKILIMLFFLTGIISCTKDQPEQKEIIRPIRSMIVGNAEQLSGRDFPGRAKAVHEVNLAFDVNGTLNKRPVNIGDTVTKGQLIASLDSRDFVSNVKEARANVQNALANFNRAKELIKKSFISKSEYDRLNAQYRGFSAERDKAVKALSDASLKAPFSGFISELYVENFQAVVAKQLIARLVDVSQIKMIVDIPESKISIVSQVKSITVIFDAFPNRKISATVKEIGKEASSTTRTYPVTLIMDQPEGIRILPGMSGKARADAIASTSPETSIQVPLSAVFSPDDNQSYVWLINKTTKTVKKQPVTLKRISSNGLLITKGLGSGDQIATAGVHFLREGMKVRIMQNKEN